MEYKKEIQGSTKTITQRLKELEDKKLIKRKVYNEIPMRVEYYLTNDGKNLDSVFDIVSKWIEKYFS